MLLILLYVLSVPLVPPVHHVTSCTLEAGPAFFPDSHTLACESRMTMCNKASVDEGILKHTDIQALRPCLDVCD